MTRSLVCNGLWIWWRALVLHVGRQRGDKNPVSQCIAAVVATTAAAAATAVTGGVVRQAGGARVGGRRWESASFLRMLEEVEERVGQTMLRDRGRAERAVPRGL